MTSQRPEWAHVLVENVSPDRGRASPVPVRPWEGPSCPVRLSICQSIDRATFSHPPPSPSHGASRHHGGQGARKPRVTVLAFRHKPPPAKDRSENWLLPRSRLAGAAGRERTGSKPHIRTNPDEGFPRAHQTPFARGQPSSICSLSPTHPHSLSLISTSPDTIVAKSRGRRLMKNGAQSPTKDGNSNGGKRKPPMLLYARNLEQ